MKKIVTTASCLFILSSASAFASELQLQDGIYSDNSACEIKLESNSRYFFLQARDRSNENKSNSKNVTIDRRNLSNIDLCSDIEAETSIETQDGITTYTAKCGGSFSRQYSKMVLSFDAESGALLSLRSIHKVAYSPFVPSIKETASDLNCENLQLK